MEGHFPEKRRSPRRQERPAMAARSSSAPPLVQAGEGTIRCPIVARGFGDQQREERV